MGTSYEDFVTAKILRPLNMTHSGFNQTALQANIAIGLTELANGTFVVSPVEQLGWGNPMGGLLASSRDIAKFMSFLFRDNTIANGGSQILDGSTIREYLSPLINTRDGDTSFGTPWESFYNTNNNVWIRSKAGELLGYRSQVAIVPELKLGIFISVTCGQTDDSTLSAFTIPSMDILLPRFINTLWSKQPAVPLPSNYQVFTGLYHLEDTIYNTIDWQVYQKGGSLFGSYVFNGQGFPPIVNLTMDSDSVFRVSIPNTQTCRWQDDGMDQELIYFHLSQDRKTSTGVTVMGQSFVFVSQKCPSCS